MDDCVDADEEYVSLRWRGHNPLTALSEARDKQNGPPHKYKACLQGGETPEQCYLNVWGEPRKPQLPQGVQPPDQEVQPAPAGDQTAIGEPDGRPCFYNCPDVSDFYKTHGAGPGSDFYWDHGAGPGSEFYWDHGAGLGSEFYKNNGTGPGSDYYWDHGTGPGSEFYKDHGTEPGSDYYWDHGAGPGSKFYWDHGAGPGSKFYKDHGAGNGN